jgi:hypothetical protein
MISTKKIITSVILDEDILPRLGFEQLEDLRRLIVKRLDRENPQNNQQNVIIIFYFYRLA